MMERVLIVLVGALLGFVVFRLYTRRQLTRVGQNINVDPLLSGITLGVPTIVYFTTPFCVPCKTQQQPALKRLQDELGNGVQIVQIDATQQPHDADRWGVMSAPTTFILDAQGYPKKVNHGVADEHKLKAQIQQTMQVA